MEAAESAFYDIVEKVRSWIPRRVETPAMSRDFWMPDQSCRVCYECDSPFNLFNRRHHCRICGRVFCGKCTQNTLPSVDGRPSLQEERERVRVCNFCFKLRQQDAQNGAQSSTPTLTPSSSSFSLASTSTSGSSTGSSSGHPGQVSAGYSFRAPTVDGIEQLSDNKKQRRMIRPGRRSLRSVSPRGRESSPNPYDFCNNRSDDDEDYNRKEAEYHDPRLFEAQSHQDEEDDSCVEMDLADVALKRPSNDFSSRDSVDYSTKAPDTCDENRQGENVDTKSPEYQNAVTVERTLSRRSLMSSDDYEGPEESVDESNFYTPSLYQEPPPEEGEEPVDVENNALIWVPPPREDEEDETGISMADDDEDDDEGGWGSLSSIEYRSREKAAASDEQKKVMRAVVDGHFRALVAQLLNGEGMEAEEDEKDSWLEIVTFLSLQAASLVKPDTSKGGGMDPGGYVKVKCVAAGRRSESCIVKGVVCKRNIAHKRMTSRYKNPRLLLLGGALEYQRVSNQLSSLDTLLQQERDHLSMTVARIEAHHPNVLLVEKTVSRQAQERLLAKEISLVLNVKKPLLERIARCTGAEIVSAPDHLTSPKAGHCEQFHVEKYVEEHGSAGQAGKKLTKTLMFFEGCPRPLGCTVLLKGAHGDELKKVKRVVQYAVFAAYHLALETSFLVDEGATLPDLPFKSPISVALPDKQSKSDRSISIVPGFLLPASGQTQTGDSQVHQIRTVPSITNMSVSPLPSNNISSWGDVDLKVSGPAVSVPWSVTSSCVSSRTNSPGTSPPTLDIQEASSKGAGTNQSTFNTLNLSFSEMIRPALGRTLPAKVSGYSMANVSGLSASLKKASLGTLSTSTAHGATSVKSAHGRPSNVDIKVAGTNSTSETFSKTVSPTSYSSLSFAEGDGSGMGKGGLVESNSDPSIAQRLQLTSQVENQDGLPWEDQEANHEEFPPSPSDHQSILVSFSSSSLRKRVVCERGQLFRIKYYGSFDKPLGRFLRDHVFDLNNRCEMCDEPRDAHVHCYTHRQGSLTISVHRQNQVLTGEREGKIWMWHRCLKCPRVNGVPPATHRLVMSDAAWGLSFGKFLELSFSNHAAASREAACGHSLHRDCLRFYGFGSMVACFRYAPIIVHSVYLPPSKLEFNNPEQVDWLKNEASEVKDKGEVFFAKVADTLSRLTNGSGKAPEARRRIAEYETLWLKDKTAFEETLQEAAPMKHEPGRLFADILELNCTRRSLATCSALWDKRLRYLVSSLKLQKPATSSGPVLIDDPSVLLTNKDISYASSNGRPVDDQETRSIAVSSYSESSNLTQAQSTEASVQGGAPSSGGVQSNYQSVRGKLDTADEPVLNNVENNTKSDNSACVNRLLESDGAHVMGKAPIDGRIPEKEDLPLLMNKAEQTNKPGIGTAFAAGSEGSKSCMREDGKESNLEVTEEKGSTRSSILEEDLLVRRTMSEGYFPILADLSDTFEAAWTGKGHTVEAHAVHIAPNGQEIIPHGTGLSTVATGGEFASVNNVVGFEASVEGLSEHCSKSASGGSTSFHETGLIRADSVLTSTPTSPAKTGESSQDLGGWVGTPFSSLHRSYSKGSQLGSPPREDSQWLPSPRSTVPLAGPVVVQGGARVLLPFGINNTVIPVYDDEPTSIIAYAIMSHEYQAHLSDRPIEKDKLKEKDKEKEPKREKDREKDSGDLLSSEAVVSHPLQRVEGPLEQGEITLDRTSNSDENLFASSKEGLVSDPLLYSKAMHVKVSFSDDGTQGKTKYMVTCYYAKQFDALRKKCCPSEMEFIRSLCRCKKWGAQGGKSNAFFAKTADDRLVIKQVTKTELESFIKFAPDYFKYLSDSLNSGSPTCLAKILGIFQVTVKQGKGGKEVRMDLMAMENLLYGRHVTRLYDLKGSVRSRYNADPTGKNKVLLDQNLLELMLTNPIFIGSKAKRILERAVWNDTSFLASVDVMDYSLLVGVDEERQELVLGIIDFMRQYTWDKHLETWVKASGILGGPKNAAPTVISPKQYKKRFRKAMKTYFLMVPDQWSPPTEILGPSHADAASESYSAAIQDEAVEDNSSLKV